MNTPVDTELIDEDEVTERRGASGATIIITKDFTTKLDVERTGTFVRSQGEWLAQNRYELLPNVTEVLHNGYVMETLDVPDLWTLDVMDTILLIRNRLNELWKRGGRKRYIDGPGHDAYVHQLARDVTSSKDEVRELRDWLREARTSIDFGSLRTGLTHGDCIIDNVAYREGVLVLLDPIPATYAIPDFVASDVGRLIQSAVGYESIRYRNFKITTDFDTAVGAVLNAHMHRFSVNEARAAIYFAIIHTLRGVRTTKPGTAARLGLWYLVKKLQGVLLKWTR